MALLYKKRIEGNAIIYDFTTKTRWLVILAIPIGFILFITSIKLGFDSPYAVPMLLVSLPMVFGAIGIAALESLIFGFARMKAARATILKKGVIKLEGKIEVENRN
jgi:hypothetical protein